jgi:hypothetical protein
MSTHDTKLQPGPVCPHCGFKHDDAWEWDFGLEFEGTSEGRQCYRCDGEFDCERVVDVSYTTKPHGAAVAKAEGIEQ